MYIIQQDVCRVCCLLSKMFIDGASIKPRKGSMTAPWTMTSNKQRMRSVRVMNTEKLCIRKENSVITLLTRGRALLINDAKRNDEQTHFRHVAKVRPLIVVGRARFVLPLLLPPIVIPRVLPPAMMTSNRHHVNVPRISDREEGQCHQ